MRITLKQRKLKSGKISLIIEYSKGTEISSTGKRKYIREFENLKLFLHGNPSNAKERKENKDNLQLAENILAIRQSEVLRGKYGFKNKNKGQRCFLDFFHEKTEEKYESSRNYGNWAASLLHLQKCISPNLTFDEVDDYFLKQVKEYFDNKALTKSKLPLSLNSKYAYHNKFRAALRLAFEEGYLTINYAQKVKGFKQAESQREYLTFNEVQNLAKTFCKYDVLKRAFLFSCLTGLRWSDISTMVWSEVRDEDDVFRIVYRQEKTDTMLNTYIYQSKLEIF
ncbi:site-specific integrase [Flavobacterium agricola]|uniref:site-specific integrase n=1 Tax=Flavobacterium agricola TaxID=2870839 RepID=UPI002939040A|nr:site-specific integrase [Flavobacterium agricola]